LEMVLAGKVVEDGALGHHLEGGYAGDLRVWLAGSGLERPDKEAIESLLGTSVAQVEEDVRIHLTAEYPRVRRLTAALSGQEPSSRPRLLSYDEGPWSMTYDEVVAVLSDP
jgi:hypothetical protein